MDEGSRYFLAMLINKLQVSYGKNKKGTNRVNMNIFPDLEEDYYSGGGVVIRAVGVDKANQMH